MAFVGLLIAAGGYYLIAQWPVDLLAARHDLGLFTLPVLDTDLAIAGLGLGLVIGPLTSATLRVVPSAQHGIASAAVVVARMIGMLVGIAALSAWGLYRFNQILAVAAQRRPATTWRQARRGGGELQDRVRRCSTARCSESPRSSASSARCSALLISGRNEHADEPADRRVDATTRRPR